MKPVLVPLVLEALRDVGPMTRAQLADYLEIDKRSFGSLFGYLMRQCRIDVFGKVTIIPKRVYIIRWVRDDQGARNYPRRVYALGDKPDAKKPPPLTYTQLNQRRYKTCTAAVSSVFQLGEPIRHRVKMSGHRRGLRMDKNQAARPTPPDSGTSCS